MRIRNTQSAADVKAMRPVKGDTVYYHGVEHVIIQMGMRWVYLYRADDPTKFRLMAKATEIAKKPPGADVQA